MRKQLRAPSDFKTARESSRATPVFFPLIRPISYVKSFFLWKHHLTVQISSKQTDSSSVSISTYYQAFVRRYTRPRECIRTFASGAFSALVQSRPIPPHPPLPVLPPSIVSIIDGEVAHVKNGWLLKHIVLLRQCRVTFALRSHLHIHAFSRAFLHAVMVVRN